jgi:hypothetical protein
MQYQAIPLLDLLQGLPAATHTLEARATDGFASQLPWTLIAHGASGGAVAWIAIEDPARPWPHLKGKPATLPLRLVETQSTIQTCLDDARSRLGCRLPGGSLGRSGWKCDPSAKRTAGAFGARTARVRADLWGARP